jgi:hypothetical protein
MPSLTTRVVLSVPINKSSSISKKKSSKSSIPSEASWDNTALVEGLATRMTQMMSGPLLAQLQESLLQQASQLKHSRKLASTAHSGSTIPVSASPSGADDATSFHRLGYESQSDALSRFNVDAIDSQAWSFEELALAQKDDPELSKMRSSPSFRLVHVVPDVGIVCDTSRRSDRPFVLHRYDEKCSTTSTNWLIRVPKLRRS